MGVHGVEWGHTNDACRKLTKGNGSEIVSFWVLLFGFLPSPQFTKPIIQPPFRHPFSAGVFFRRERTSKTSCLVRTLPKSVIYSAVSPFSRENGIVSFAIGSTIDHCRDVFPGHSSQCRVKYILYIYILFMYFKKINFWTTDFRISTEIQFVIIFI